MSEALFQEALRRHQAGRLAEAGPLYEQVLRNNPRHFHALYLLGFVHFQLEAFETAERLIGNAIVLNPHVPDAFYNRGCALQKLRRDEDAVAAFDRALLLNPDYTDALFNRATSFLSLQRFPEALADLDAALRAVPDDSQAWHNRGNALLGLRRFGEAAASFERALALAPEIDYAPGRLLYCKLQCCDWSRFADEKDAVARGIAAGKRVAAPLEAVIASPSPDAQYRCARLWVARECPTPSAPPLYDGRIYRHDRIRIAYISADFRAHAVAHQIVGVLEHHDRSQFAITAISYGADDGSDIRMRVRKACEDFIDVRGRSDADIAKLLHRNEIDIAVDLTGHTMDGRVGIFARRGAALQVNFLGYPGTLGTDCIDYIIADATVIPAGDERFYAERIARLPETFFPTDSRRPLTAAQPSRTEAGLPEHAFVFCSFNAICKLSPETFAVWMRLLKGVAESVLWLPAPGEDAVRNLRARAAEHGIAPERIIFAPFLSSAQDHLARLPLADVFLDTWPYNAHTTASDALWMGLPVLGYRGETFAGRVGASLLGALDMPELIAPSIAAYESMALHLARDPAALAALRAKLLRHRETAPLFQTGRYTRHLESAYRIMRDRHESGASPADFAVDHSD